eukprot:613216-Rhodomonas_salina.2
MCCTDGADGDNRGSFQEKSTPPSSHTTTGAWAQRRSRSFMTRLLIRVPWTFQRLLQTPMRWRSSLRARPRRTRSCWRWASKPRAT